jgi:hypothetical protein
VVCCGLKRTREVRRPRRNSHFENRPGWYLPGESAIVKYARNSFPQMPIRGVQSSKRPPAACYRHRARGFEDSGRRRPLDLHVLRVCLLEGRLREEASDMEALGALLRFALGMDAANSSENIRGSHRKVRCTPMSRVDPVVDGHWFPQLHRRLHIRPKITQSSPNPPIYFSARSIARQKRGIDRRFIRAAFEGMLSSSTEGRLSCLNVS